MGTPAGKSDTAEPQGRRLPPGSHGIPADVVARNQRERLIAAMAEVCAEEGYARSSVEKVAKRAGVSSVTFYKQFDGKQGCMIAAHEELSARLLEALGSGPPREQLGSLLAMLAADPPSARLLTVEVLAAGPEGVRRHDTLVAALAERLDAGWVSTAGVLALVGRLTVEGDAERLPTLADDLAAIVASNASLLALLA